MLNLVWIRVVFLESDIVVGSPWPCVILKTMWKMARIVHTKCEFCGRLKQSVGSRNSETLETQIFWSLGSSCLAKYIKIHQNTRKWSLTSKEVSGPNGFCHHGRSVEGRDWDSAAELQGCPTASSWVAPRRLESDGFLWRYESLKKGIFGGSPHSNSQNMPQIIS